MDVEGVEQQLECQVKEKCGNRIVNVILERIQVSGKERTKSQETGASLRISPAKQDCNVQDAGRSSCDSDSGKNRPPRRRTAAIYTHYFYGGSQSSDCDDIGRNARGSDWSDSEPEDASDSEFKSPLSNKTKRKTKKTKKTSTKVDHGNKITQNKDHNPNPKKLKTEGSTDTEAKFTTRIGNLNVSNRNKDQHLQSNHPDAERPKYKGVRVACDFCPVSVDKSYMWQHLDRKHPEQLLKGDFDKPRKFKCDLCPYKCQLQRGLLSHTLKAHVVDKPCECDICFESFLTQELLQQHVKRAHEDKNFNCRYCPTKSFKDSASLKKHIEAFHKSYHGKNCDSDSEPASTNHHLCPVCETLFITDADFAKHLKKPETKSVMKCKLCSEPVYTPCRLSLHLQKMHSNTSKADVSIKREQLEAIIESPAPKEQSHSKKHTETTASVINQNQKSPNKFSCIVCTANFPRRCDLDFHELQENHRRWKCPICEKLLKAKTELKYHLSAVHSDARPFKCTHEGCSNSFKLIRNLQKHMIMHDPDRVQCKNCYNYFSKDAFQLHFDTYHKRDEPFKCDVCSKIFGTQKRLKQHLHVHSDPKEERRYPCKFCGSVYKYSKGRSRHLKKCLVRLEVEKQENFKGSNVSLGFGDNETATSQLTCATDSLHGNGTELILIKQEVDHKYFDGNSSNFDDE